MTVLVVRHAHAGDRSRWSGDDRLRPLSEIGARQATSIGTRLELHRPDRVLSSPAVRCLDTVVPLARRLGLDVEADDRLFEGADASGVKALLHDVEHQTVVLCSHGDVIPEILGQMLGEGMRPDRSLRWEKASTWVVERNGRGWGAGTYVPAPPD